MLLIKHCNITVAAAILIHNLILYAHVMDSEIP